MGDRLYSITTTLVCFPGSHPTLPLPCRTNHSSTTTMSSDTTACQLLRCATTLLHHRRSSSSPPGSSSCSLGRVLKFNTNGSVGFHGEENCCYSLQINLFLGDIDYAETCALSLVSKGPPDGKRKKISFFFTGKEIHNYLQCLTGGKMPKQSSSFSSPSEIAGSSSSSSSSEESATEDFEREAKSCSIALEYSSSVLALARRAWALDFCVRNVPWALMSLISEL
ncbi:hypothetical protein AB3S75_037310 [Citrus x aurantiifolia]